MSQTRFVAHYSQDGREQSVAKHLSEVAAMAKTYAGKIGLGCAGELAGLLHDLGKYSEAFRTYLASATGQLEPDADEYVDAGALKGKIDHSTAGAQHIWRQLRGRSDCALASQAIALCIASHHSGLIDCLAGSGDNFGQDNFTRRMEKAGALTHLDEALGRAEAAAILDRAAELMGGDALREEFQRLGKRIVAVRGQSNTATALQLGLAARFLFSGLIDADRTNTADFENERVKALRQSGEYAGWEKLSGRLETSLAAREIREPVDELRREISKHCLDAAGVNGGIYTLTVPTGGGKTLASLRFALRHAQQRRLERIFYIIPFTSIIDQNAEVVREILELTPEEQGSIVLEHHSNLMPEEQTWRESILAQNWDAPIVMTTMVQFLDSLFGAGTRGARRMHQLANSVLIFDEVQTVPVKCVHLFNNAVNFLAEQCNSTVVLCTATQPLLHKVEKELGAIRLTEKHALVPEAEKLFERLKRVEITDERRPGGWTHRQVGELAMSEMRRAGSCLVVVNTKRSAREIYEAVAEVEKEARFHLSTHMCPAHRKQKLAQMRERLEHGLPVLCVSTQLIEAGVDVDFGAVVRALAGMDSIAQAAGRCNRNGRSNPGTVHVVNLADEKLGALPEIQLGAALAEQILDDFRADPEIYGWDLCAPQAMNDYYRYYFFARREAMAYEVEAKKLESASDDTLLNLLSANSHALAEHTRNRKAAPPINLRQAFMTAAKAFRVIDAPTEGLVVPHEADGQQAISDLCAAFDVEKQYGLLKRAQQFTVNVFPTVMQKLKEASAVHAAQDGVRVFYLDARFYSEEYGLVEERVAGMEDLSA